MKKSNPRFGSDAEPIVYDGRIYEFEPFKYWFMSTEFRGYAIHEKGSKNVLGFVSPNVTDQRIESLIYRRLNPDHMKPCSFVGTVRGMTYCVGGEPSRQSHYVTIPANVARESNIRVDDEIEFKIDVLPSDGGPIRTYSTPVFYHVGAYGGNLGINLTRFYKLHEKAPPLVGENVRVTMKSHPSEFGRWSLTPFAVFTAEDLPEDLPE